ncbi:Protein-tyrosine kinase (fragment) [Burkholderiales bacterium]
MTRLVGELAAYDPNRVVLFDAPPLLAAPETRALAAQVGQIVLVIEAQRTPRNTVTEALELIKDFPVVMTLLNKVHGGAGAGYGYGSYGYHSEHGFR